MNENISFWYFIPEIYFERILSGFLEMLNKEKEKKKRESVRNRRGKCNLDVTDLPEIKSIRFNFIFIKISILIYISTYICRNKLCLTYMHAKCS